MPGNPASKTINPRVKASEKAPRKPAKSLKDWKDEEATEAESKPVRPYVGGPLTSAEDIVVGEGYKFINWADPAWVPGKQSPTVYAFYPSARVIVDYPGDLEELEAKQAFFKEAKIPYLGVLPGEPLKSDEAKALLRKQGAKIAA